MAVMDRFSVFAFALGDPPPAASELIAAARHADSLGFHSISLPHHSHVACGAGVYRISASGHPGPFGASTGYGYGD